MNAVFEMPTMPDAIAAPPSTDVAPSTAALDITAVVHRVRTYGTDGDFARIDAAVDNVPCKIVGELDGNPMTAGVSYRFFGRWEHHPKFGRQFKFDSFTTAAQQSQSGVVNYLARSDFGIRKPQAEKLWKQYGVDTIETLRRRPEQVIADGILDADLAGRVAAKLQVAEASEATKIALFELFAGFGFPKSTVKGAIAQWGEMAPAIIRRDPFKLLVAEIAGAGFSRADKLFLALGGNPARLKRQMLAAWHWLRTNSTGNTWEIEGGMSKAVLKAAGSMDAAEFDRAVALGLRAAWIAKRQDESSGEMYYAERANAESEKRLAMHLRRVMGYRPRWVSLDAGEGGITEHQRERLAVLAGSAVGILAGTPGTGKTFTAAAILRRLLATLPASQVAVAAPTGKAAVRISEAMQRYKLPLEASTIHRLLKVGGQSGGKWSFFHDESNPLPHKVFVIDESSMIDTDLMSAFFAAVPPGANVLLIGDPFQLPPVGHGAPLRDLIAAAGVPCGLLTEIKRNAGRIVTACRDIKDGTPFGTSPGVDIAAGENLLHVHADTPEMQRDTICSLARTLGENGYNPIWDVQVLVATNDKTLVSRRALNVTLQNLLNPQDETVVPERRNPRFRVGDKVICLKNATMAVVERESFGDEACEWNVSTVAPSTAPVDPRSYKPNGSHAYIANGDMGKVEAVDATCAIVRFLLPDRVVKVITTKRRQEGDEREEEQADFDLAYAVTVHKSQGSEWRAVVVVIDDNAGPIGCREWLYTAISRAGELCFLVGKLGVAMRMAAKASLTKRKTFLRELVVANDGKGPTGAASTTPAAM